MILRLMLIPLVWLLHPPGENLMSFVDYRMRSMAVSLALLILMTVLTLGAY